MIPAHLQNRTLEQLRATQETIRCFFVESIGEGFESIIVMEKGPCIAGFDYHRTEKVVKRYALDPLSKEHPEGWMSDEERHKLVPTYCTRCGNHEFSQQAFNRLSGSKGRVWERVDTGERADTLNAFGPGAMWYVTWYNREDKDGKHLGYFHPHFGNKIFPNPPLSVRTPGGDWVIDSRANNCTLPEDNEHKCWPRQGTPPLITVDKSFGPTCHAGAGSIVCGDYHGFLRDGFLIKC